MGTKWGQLKVGSIGKLPDLIVEPTILAILSVPKNEIAIFESSDDTLADHDYTGYLSFSDVELLPDYYQVQMKFFRAIDEDRIGAFEEGFEGGPEGEQKDGGIGDGVGGLDKFFDDWRYPEDEVVEQMVGIKFFYLVDIDGVILRALVGKISVFERQRLALVVHFVIKGLIQRVFKETTFNFIYIDLVSCYVTNR